MSESESAPRPNVFLRLLYAAFERREVTSVEMELVLPMEGNGWLETDIQRKLAELHPRDPVHAELRTLVQLAYGLVRAVHEGRYRRPEGWAEAEPRLLRALAYFVKNGDAIADDQPGGFDDDHREFQDLEARAAQMLRDYESWQLTRGAG